MKKTTTSALDQFLINYPEIKESPVDITRLRVKVQQLPDQSTKFGACFFDGQEQEVPAEELTDDQKMVVEKFNHYLGEIIFPRQEKERLL